MFDNKMALKTRLTQQEEYQRDRKRYEKMMDSVPNNEEVNTKDLIVFMFDGDKTKG